MLKQTRKWLAFFVVILFGVFAAGQAQAKDPLAGLFDSQPEFLPVDDAFGFFAKQDGQEVKLEWIIADDYYLYADKFQFVVENATLVETQKPDATQIEDEFFGVVDVYFFQAKISAILKDIQPNAVLKVRYQGCAMAGLCYQPVTKTVDLESVTESKQMAEIAAQYNQTQKDQSEVSLQNELLDSLNNQNLLGVLAVFFVLGVGLAFTPCVFPMFPILSGIIAGQQNMTLKKGLYLSFIYVQGMALTYSLLGLVVASLGAQFQAALQHPAILVGVSVIFIALAGGMFGWYTLQLPQSWTSRLTEVSNQQKSGNVIGVFMMGLLSGLIASPCTTAPLTGALLYVAQTGDLVTGFFTLYVLSLGMGLPLLLIGASGGKLLPKAGNWMNVVKNVFGFILLTLPLILFQRFVEVEWILVASGVLTLVFAAYMHSQYIQAQSANVKSGFWLVSWVSLLFGLILILQPFKEQMLPNNTTHQAQHNNTEFVKVVTLEDIDSQVLQASQRGQVVMLDLYADWCVACKEFEAFTFSEPKVQQQMSNMLLLQVDMTENSEQDVEIMERYNVLGLPTIIFFNKSGEELTTQRVTGFMGAEAFLDHLERIL